MNSRVLANDVLGVVTVNLTFDHHILNFVLSPAQSMYFNHNIIETQPVL